MRWNTLRAAKIGALVGLIPVPFEILFDPYWLWLYHKGWIFLLIDGGAFIVGSMAALAVPAALLCGIQNLFVRRA